MQKKTTTSKIALIVFSLICAEILVYTEIVMYRLADISAISVLIGIPVALASALIGYFFKSSKENTIGGVTYETALYSLKQQTFQQLSENTENIEDEDLVEIDLDNAVG